MAANGNGVNLDASVTPLRIACHNETHADAQNDGVDYAYNLNKLWACMGRVGVNAVMRYGLVEEGDPVTPAASCWIETVAAGVWGGVNLWDTITGYNPLGGLAAGDYCVFAALAPPDELVLHLDAALGAQPNFAVEYCTAVGPNTWVALTVTATPDFRQVNGRNVQRLRFTRPTNWAERQLTGSAMPRGYYCFRIYLNAPVGAGPTANYNYKDWLDGYHKNWYSHFDIKRGDDTVNADITSWIQPGGFTLRFRPNFTMTCKTTLIDVYEMGTKHLADTNYRPGYGWAIVATKGANIGRGGVFYGGSIMLRPRHDTEAAGLVFWGASLATQGILKYCMISGIQGAGVTFGAASSTAFMEMGNVLMWDSPVALNGNIIGTMALDVSKGRSWNIVLAAMPGQSRFISSSIPSATLGGFSFVGDAASSISAQVNMSGGGTKQLYTPRWAGSAKKWTGSFTNEIWYAPGYVTDKATGLPIVIAFRITDSLGAVQASGTTGTDGKTTFINQGGYGALTVGPRNENIIVATRFTAPTTETDLDLPLTIEINPTNHASYNPAYESIEIRTEFPRELRYNDQSQIFELISWQRQNLAWSVALGSSAPPAPIMVSDIPVAAHGEVRYQVVMPSEVV